MWTGTMIRKMGMSHPVQAGKPRSNRKTHDQIERADRVDSFDAGKCVNCGLMLASRDGHSLPLRYDRYTLYVPKVREVVELSYPGSRWSCTLELARVPSGFGGSRAFWLCPRCGQRARYQYFKDQGFVCRSCARLNYRSQQRTKDSLNHFQDGMRLATEKLHWAPLIDVMPMDFRKRLTLQRTQIIITPTLYIESEMQQHYG